MKSQSKHRKITYLALITSKVQRILLIKKFNGGEGGREVGRELGKRSLT